MRAFVISPQFLPEPGVSARTSFDIATELDAKGYETVVITTYPNRPGGKIYDGYTRRLYSKDPSMGNFETVRCYSVFSQVSTVFSRFLENITFGIFSALYVLAAKRSDIIYANTWSIFAQGLLHLAASVRKTPVVLSIQDLYPESLNVQQRINTKNTIYRLLKRIDKWNVHNSKATIVISNHLADVYANDRKLPAEKLHVIPNWGNIDFFEGAMDSGAMREKHGISTDEFLLVYGGNIGAAAGLDSVIEAMRLMDGGERLLIAGEGSYLHICKEQAGDMTGERIFFHHPWPLDETGVVYAAADVLVLPTQGQQALASVPSKLISYMLAGKPVLAMVEESSEIANAIEQSGCGWIIEPDNPAMFAQKVSEIKAMTVDALTELGAAGRAYALANFTREVNVAKVLMVLES